MRTKSRTRLPLLAPVFVSALVLGAAPAISDEESEVAAADDVTDAGTVRIPAVTKFPMYPPIARRDRIEGEVTVCFTIAPDGGILEAEVASSTHEIFEKPALEAIQASSFEPLAPGEELSPTPVCRTYRFRLDPVEPEEEVAAGSGSSLRSSV